MFQLSGNSLFYCIHDENKNQDLFLYNTKGIDKIKPLFSERYTFLTFNGAAD